MVLKQWLFQRKMNEVYSRGGLSSYALFLLILSTIHTHSPQMITTVTEDELLGRYLMEFLNHWCSSEAVAEVIRPLKAPMDKNWPELFQPYGLCMFLTDYWELGGD
jgi:hypothetical protein